ncbi:hypothetical protein H2203_002161 [Taxawa tesnikishii (nom. ined.)]|nr:hypothetical protein H2203_002161 [Dothideales sp. JES 119]
MASPPRAFSPPHNSLSLPMKRPSLTLPSGGNPVKRRKPSTASVSAHPLRQTSFPPPDLDGGVAYSPTESHGSRDSLDIDDELASNAGSADGTTDGRGKRGRKSKKEKSGKLGRPSGKRAATGSLIDGETGSVAPSARKGAAADEEEENEEEDEDVAAEETGDMESGKLTRESMHQDRERKAMFQRTVKREHQELYALWNSAKLREQVVRRLTNQTLSQSVPGTVVQAINSMTKLFVGELVDRAKQVQEEWIAASEKLPTGRRMRHLGKKERAK